LFRGELNNAKASATQYTTGEPGCWWIKTGDFIDGTSNTVLDEITTDVILEVHPTFPYLYPNISDPFIAEYLEGLQKP
jgi:hypothetical protein